MAFKKIIFIYVRTMLLFDYTWNIFTFVPPITLIFLTVFLINESQTNTHTVIDTLIWLSISKLFVPICFTKWVIYSTQYHRRVLQQTLKHHAIDILRIIEQCPFDLVLQYNVDLTQYVLLKQVNPCYYY